MDQDQINKVIEQFFKDGQKISKAYLSNPEKIDKKALFAGMKHQYGVIDSVISALEEQAGKGSDKSDCKRGCSYCCHQTVLALPHEIFYLAEHLKDKFSPDALSKILERASTKNDKGKHESLKKRLTVIEPCPLLHPTGKFCRAYTARPMACRIYLSKSVESCKAQFNNPTDNSVYAELFNLPLQLGQHMNEGFTSHLRTYKIDPSETTISQGLVTVLEKDCFEGWAKGKHVFPKLV